MANLLPAGGLNFTWTGVLASSPSEPRGNTIFCALQPVLPIFNSELEGVLPPLRVGVSTMTDPVMVRLLRAEMLAAARVPLNLALPVPAPESEVIRLRLPLTPIEPSVAEMAQELLTTVWPKFTVPPDPTVAAKAAPGAVISNRAETNLLSEAKVMDWWTWGGRKNDLPFVKVLQRPEGFDRQTYRPLQRILPVWASASVGAGSW